MIVAQSLLSIHKRNKSLTRCGPSKGRRCIPDAALKNEGPMVQTCRNINVHVVNTDMS